MPEKTVSIRIDLQETGIKAKLKELASEMKVLSSEAQLNEKAFAGQQNSLEALTTKYNNLQSKIKNLNEQIDTHRQGQAKLEADYKKVGEELENATKKQASYKASLENIAKVMQKWTAIRDEAERQGKEEVAKYNEIEKALAKLDRQYKGSKRESEEYKTKHKELSDQLEQSGKRLGELQKQHNKADAVVRRSESTIKTWTERAETAGKEADNWRNKQAQLTQGINRHVAETNKAEAQVTEYTSQIDLLAEAIVRATNNYKGVDTETDRWTGDLKENEEAIEAVAQAMAVQLVQQGFNVVKEAITDSIDAFKEYETALAGVSKTTGMEWGGEDIKSLGDDFKALSQQIPVSAKELLNVAQIAGQLGIQGSDNIQEFTKVMAQMSVSTNLSAEEAATALAQMAAVTGMASSDYEKLGSAIVALGNNFATNEETIVRIAQRFSGAAVNAKLADSEIVALAAAAGSVGLQAESAGTSLTKLVNKMGDAVQSGDDLEKWAAVANMTANDFKRLWGEDAPVAIAKFLYGFGQLGEEATQTFGELGIGESRLQDLVNRMSNAEVSMGLLTNALKEANTAFEEGVALSKEAEVAFSTLESKTKILNQSVEVLGIEVGAVLSPQLSMLTEMETKIVQKTTELVQKYPDVIKGLEVITVFVGALALKALPDVLKPLQNIIGGFKELGTAMTDTVKGSGVVQGFAELTGSMAASLAIVTALIVAFTALAELEKNHYEKAKEGAIEATEPRKRYLETVTSEIELQSSLQEEMKKLNELQSQQTWEIEAYGEATAETNAKINAQAELIMWLRDKMENFREATDDASTSEQAFGSIVSEAISKVSELGATFDENLAKVKDFSTEYTKGADSYLTEIQRQIDWNNTYADNRQKVLDMDIEGIDLWVASWDNGTAEAAEKMNAMANADKDEIEGIMNKELELAEATKRNSDEYKSSIEDAFTEAANSAIAQVGNIQTSIDSLHGKEIVINVRTEDGGVHQARLGYAQGLDYVPYDGFSAMLHEGEKVLNRAEASAYRKLERTVTNTTNNNNNNNVVLNVYGGKGQSADELSDIIMKKIQQATNRRQAVWA